MITHEDILDSKYGSVVLAFLLLAPERAFSSKELGKRLKLSDKLLTQVFREFVKDSLVKQFRKGTTSLFLINTKHKLLPEIRSSLIKNQKPYEDELFAAIHKLGDIKSAYLSGIFTGQPHLPVDLLLVGKVSLTKLDVFLKQCQQMMGVELNYSIMTAEEFQIRKDTFDRFIKDIFDYPHIQVVRKSPKFKSISTTSTHKRVVKKK